MKIGFIGLGQMGKPMAFNLGKNNPDLIVTSRRSDSFPEFQQRGIKTTSNIQDIAQCDIVFLCLPDTETVGKILSDKAGLGSALRKGQIIADLSTINYTASIEIARKLAKKGVEFMEAPITGMPARAIDGTLTIMCGGQKETFDVLLPYLKSMGNNIVHMGAHGCGQLMKALNNILYNINIAGLTEILSMSLKLGLNSESVGTVINSGTGRSYASEFFISRILERNFSGGYPMERGYVDFKCIAELAANIKTPLPVTNASSGVYQTALLKGLGAGDKGSMICVYEELFGVKFTK